MSSDQPHRPSISVIVPAHRGGVELTRCLDSLERLSPPPLERIVVVDGDDADVRRAAEASGARVLGLSPSGGPARARNAGAREARGDVLFFLDADVSACPDAVAAVASLFAGDASLAAVVGSYDDAPSAPGFLSQYRNLLHHYVHQTSRGEASTFWGACGAIRREVFLAAGGFDEAYRHPSIEDIELGIRLRRLGHRVRMHKELQVTHHKRWTPRSMLVTDVFRRAVPWSELILRGGGLPNDLNVDRASRASVACVLALPPLAIAALWATAAPGALAAAAVAAGAFLALNLPFYRFLARRRGAGFAARAVPWHAVYYACCGLGLGVALLRLPFARRTEDRAGLTFGDQEKPAR